MLFHEIEALAQLERGANRLAVVFGDAEQAVDAVVAFGILDAAGAHDRGVHGLRGGQDLDAVDVELAVECGRAVGVDAQDEIARNRSERRGELRGEFDVARRELRHVELQAGRVDAGAGAEEMNVQRALRECGVDRDASAHGVVGVGLNQRSAERILHGALRDEAAHGGRAVADDGIGRAPNEVRLLIGAAGSERASGVQPSG